MALGGGIGGGVGRGGSGTTMRCGGACDAAAITSWRCKDIGIAALARDGVPN